MSTQPRIVVTVSAEGVVSAETEGLVGAECLDYIAVLEDLLEARTTASSFTADYTRTRADLRVTEEDRNIELA